MVYSQEKVFDLPIQNNLRKCIQNHRIYHNYHFCYETRKIESMMKLKKKNVKDMPIYSLPINLNYDCTCTC